jgi:hypothetical protein
MGFASGFTAGFFGNVDRALQEEFRTAKAETARLTNLRQARTAQRNDAREAKVEKANEEIQALAGKIGPGSGIILNDFIQEGGLAYAKEATTKLLNYTQKTGITPVQFYNLTAEELGKKPTAQFFNTLAQSAVPAVKPLGEPVTTAGGIAEYFGYGGPEVVKKKTEAGLSSIGGKSIRDISGLTEIRGGITDTAIPVEFGFNAQKEMAARKVVSLMEEINNPNISKENKLELQEKLKAANATLDGIRKVEATMAPDKSFEDQYRRAIAEGDTKGAQAILDAATKYHMGTATPKYQGNTGAFTLKMIDRARKLVDDEIGFDPRNPDKTVPRRMKQADGSFKLVPVPGEEMQKIRKAKQLQTFLNLRNRLLPKGNDFNSITALDDLDAEIKMLREQLGEGNTDTSTVTAPVTGSDKVVSPTTFGSPSTKEDPSNVGSTSIPLQNRYAPADTTALPKGNTIGGADGKGGTVTDLIDSYSAKFRIGSQQGRQKFIDSVKNNKGKAIADLIKNVEQRDKVTMSREVASMILDKIVENIEDFKSRGTTEVDTRSGIEPKVVNNRPSSMIRLPQ